MAGISIERLALQLPAMTEAQGRRLALGIADGLAAAGLDWAGGEYPTMRIDLTAGSVVDADRLAKQVVAEIARQLHRVP
ncbi:MAG: hypothetical protein ACLPV8_27270 [Steroidobacteraceae bacterium]